ncbi:hypothetical protein VTL71DRAFT_11450 [Oculimacula yallundae]|uniref:Uncharacterized protein n=1 Tax=Oculimacula yallundae TaxID=86028 RepID=A0ABR4CRA3_9HELO
MKSSVFLCAATAVGYVAATPIEHEITLFVKRPGQDINLDRRAVPSKCSPDNCARAVTGLDKGPAVQSAHRNDCISLFSYTSIPPTVTDTVYVTPHLAVSTTQTLATVTVTPATSTIPTTVYLSYTATNAPDKRAISAGSLISPSLVPAYASPCSGLARFSSACACWSITPVTATLPTPTITITLTAEAEIDSTYSATATASSFATATVPLASYTYPASCDKLAYANGYPYRVWCGQSGVVADAPLYVAASIGANSWEDCLAWIGANYAGMAIEYRISTKTCTAYTGWWTYYRYADPDVVFGGDVNP